MHQVRVGAWIAVLSLCAASAGCGGVSTEQPETGEPAPTSEETPSATPTATPGGAPAPGLRRVSVTFLSVHVYDDSEPWLTEPGECLFAVDANGNDFETPSFDCYDDSVYALSFPTVDLDLGPSDTLFVSAAGWEDDPTGYDPLGSFDLQFGASSHFGEGQHVQAGLLGGDSLGNFEMTFVVATQ